jgi:hypothetical protein
VGARRLNWLLRNHEERVIFTRCLYETIQFCPTNRLFGQFGRLNKAKCDPCVVAGWFVLWQRQEP